MQILRTNSNDPRFHTLIQLLDADLYSRYREQQEFYGQFNKVPDLPTVVIALENDQPIGCGCFRHFDESSVEIKRMFVVEKKRGTGVAEFILQQLEEWARELGYRKAVLETGNKQYEALRFYKREGFKEIPNYPPYEGLESSICMQKALL